VYKRADGKLNGLVEDVAGVSKSKYNPAVEAREPTQEDVATVISRTNSSEWMVTENKMQAQL
jgi:hypothetical protein